MTNVNDKLIDSLVDTFCNSMERMTEQEFVSHCLNNVFIDDITAKKLYKVFWDTDARIRIEYDFEPGNESWRYLIVHTIRTTRVKRELAAIDTIRKTYPIDSADTDERLIGARLLADALINTWRELPLAVLEKYAAHCRTHKRLMDTKQNI